MDSFKWRKETWKATVNNYHNLKEIITGSKARWDVNARDCSCLPNASSSARGESLGPPQVFHKHAHSPGNIHRPKYEHGLPDYQEHMRAFPSPPWIPHSPTFLNFLVSPLFAQLLSSASNHFSILELKCLEDFRTFQIWPIKEGREFNPRKGLM